MPISTDYTSRERAYAEAESKFLSIIQNSGDLELGESVVSDLAMARSLFRERFNMSPEDYFVSLDELYDSRLLGRISKFEDVLTSPIG